MSYQPKSLRKFMAASISTAVVASAVAPVVANAESNFTDVQSNDWFYDAVNYLTSKDVLDGFEDGSFRPSEDVTRAQAAKILAVTLELDVENTNEVSFPDVDEDAWYANYVSALVEEGVINGFEDGTFRPDETLTRAQMAKMITEAYDIKAAEDAEIPFEDLEGATWAKEYIAALYDAGIVDGVKEDEFAPLANVTRAQVAAFVYKTEIAGDDEQPEEPEEPSATVVEDAKATSLVQVEVTFNNENYDEDEAKDPANYEIEDTDGDELDIKDVDVDGKTATLTLEEAAANQTDATITVDSAVTGEEAEFDLNFFDNSIPEIEDVKVVGKDTVKLMFNEPMNFEADDNNVANSKYEDEFEIKVGNKSYTVDKIDVLKNGKEANVKVFGSFDEGELSLSVENGLEDFAGFNLVPVTKTVDVMTDEEAPEVVDYKDAEPNKVTLVFNEDIQLEDDAVENFYHTNTGNKVKEGGVTVDGNELTLEFADENEMPEGTAYVYVKEGAVSDLWDNENADDIRTAVEVKGDEEAPEIDEIEATKDQATLTFTEEVDEDTAEDKDNYTILDADGDEVEGAIRRIVQDGDTVVVHFDDELDNGDYSIVVEGVEDTEGNEMSSVTKDFTVEDEDTPTIDEVLLEKEDDKEFKVIVRYSEKMDLDGKYSVLDLGIYDLIETNEEGTEVARQNLQDLADESDVDVEIDAVENGEAVEITVDGADISNYNELTIARAADAAGNYTAIGASKEIEGTDTKKIGFEEVTATAKDELEVTFDGSLEDIELKDFAVFADANGDGLVDDGESIAVSSVERVDGDEVKFTLAEDLSADVMSPEDIQYKLVAVGEESTNRYGSTLDKDAQEVIVDEIAPSVMEDEDDVKQVTANGKTVTIVFDEAVQWVNNGTFVVNDGDNKVTAVEGNGTNTITLTTEEEVFEGDTVDQEAVVADMEGNKTTGLKLEVESVTSTK
ncbi:S-layer homology domain-containing protein [Bacillus tianshenii]|nr:S-layer homology domain-containing protein [Bacillus tianshenii]